MRSFKSNENIHKKEGGSYYVVSANKASSVTLQSGVKIRWRPGVAKTQDFRNALDKVIMLLQGLWVILIWVLS